MTCLELSKWDLTTSRGRPLVDLGVFRLKTEPHPDAMVKAVLLSDKGVNWPTHRNAFTLKD
jgi:hypothetical protein